MTQIKICGITRAEDAELAAALGADFLGFVFVRESPRYVVPELVRELKQFPLPASAGRGGSEATGEGTRHERGTPPHPNPLPTAVRLRRGEGTGDPLVVGVFRDASIDEVRRVAEIAQLDLVQLHGSENDEYVRAIDLPVIKAFNVAHALPDTTSSASWIMFDTGGGSGRRFDWRLLAGYPRTKRFFLAGGLTPDNVAEAIRETRPDAVDVSSGVEAAPGVKDHQKLRDFFERVRRT